MEESNESLEEVFSDAYRETPSMLLVKSVKLAVTCLSLKEIGYNVKSSRSFRHALNRLAQESYDIVISGIENLGGCTPAEGYPADEDVNHELYQYRKEGIYNFSSHLGNYGVKLLVIDSMFDYNQKLGGYNGRVIEVRDFLIPTHGGNFDSKLRHILEEFHNAT